MYSTYSKKSSFISSISYHYTLMIFTRFLRVCWDLILRYIMYTFFNTIIFFLFFFVNSISISFLLSSLILSTTFILIPTSQTTCITPLQYGAFVELFLKQTKKRQRKVLNRPYYFLLMDRIFYTLLSVKTYINLCWR